MGGLLSRGGGSGGRSLAQAVKSREPFTVKLTEEALKPRPRGNSAPYLSPVLPATSYQYSMTYFKNVSSTASIYHLAYPGWYTCA